MFSNSPWIGKILCLKNTSSCKFVNLYNLSIFFLIIYLLYLLESYHLHFQIWFCSMHNYKINVIFSNNYFYINLFSKHWFCTYSVLRLLRNVYSLSFYLNFLSKSFCLHFKWWLCNLCYCRCIVATLQPTPLWMHSYGI